MLAEAAMDEVTRREWVVSAPYHSYEGVMPSGRTSACFPTLEDAEAFKRRVEIYAMVQPDYPYGNARYDSDHEVAADAWDSWDDVREFGFEDGCLTGPLSIEERTIITRKHS
jgi:hypothetical protein